ncbi:MAG: transporter substrate-binding domain-containing protein, partial [Syntrophomonas sp.]
MKRTALLSLMVMMVIGIYSGFSMASTQALEVTPYDQLSIDLNKSTVGVMTGSTNEKLVRENFKSAQVQCYDSTMDAVTALKAGHVEVVVAGFPIALNVAKNNRDLMLLPDVLQLDDTAIAVQKENTRLLDELNAVLRDLAQSGTLEDMQKRWMKEDFSPYQPVKLNVPRTGEPLRV